MKKFFQEFKEIRHARQRAGHGRGRCGRLCLHRHRHLHCAKSADPPAGPADSRQHLCRVGPGGFGIGAVINSIISFLITAFVVFLLVKGVNKLTHLKKQEEQAQKPEDPAGPTTEELLTEIRDLLKEQK